MCRLLPLRIRIGPIKRHSAVRYRIRWADFGEYLLAAGVFPPIDSIDKAKVIPIKELSDDEIAKWGEEFKKIFAVQ